jgi:elongation factor P--(R)-beta-lysine ligase
LAKTFDASPWWSPEKFADKRQALALRGAVKTAIRAHFEADGFTEVECAALCVSPGNEAHLSAFATEAIGLDGSRRTLYLHTSPEFAAKKLLAAGMEKIFDFARVFRNREGGPTHAFEFTMLEWYRVRAPYKAVMDDTLALVRLAAREAGRPNLTFRDKACDVFAAPEYLSLAEAFCRYAGIDLTATLTDDGVGLRHRLAVAAAAAGVAPADDDTWSDIFSKVLVAKIEPALGRDRPTFLDRYPRCEAALARACDDDPRFAERFELYVCGVELANGFGELTDPLEQRKRFEAEMDEKERIYGERYPIDEDFLAALAIMPPASGVALGFDRLAMLAAGARCLTDVMWPGSAILGHV